MSKYLYKKPRHLFIQKFFTGIYETKNLHHQTPKYSKGIWNEKKTGKDICILFIEKQNRKKTLLIISLKKGFFKTFSEQNKIKSSIYDEWIGIDIKRCISMQKHLSQRRIGIF